MESQASKRVNQADIARLAEVSVSTVSRALSGQMGMSAELRERIRRIADNLGYAEALRSAATEHAVVYLPMHPVNGGLHPIFQEILESARATAEQEGLALYPKLLPEGAVDLACVERNRETHGTNAAIMFYTNPLPEVADYFQREGSLVLVNAVDMDMRFDSVIANNYAGARLATRAMIESGHRRLLFVTGDLRHPWMERVRGFRDAVAMAGDVEGEVLEIGHDRYETALSRFAEIFGRKERLPFTGIVCVNDLTATGVMQAASDHGLTIPDDVSVIGFEGMAFAEMTTPRLATISVDRAAIGVEAIRLLKRRIADPRAVPQQVQHGVTFVAGGTIGSLGQ